MSIKIHSFDIEVAEEVGIEEAIIYYNLCFWIEKNKANDVHFHNGRYWTYNSVSAFRKIFPYMTDYKINASLNKLESKGYIESGNFNKSSYDRTKWYSLNSKVHLSKIKNGFIENQEPIPDSKPDSNTDSKPDSKSANQDLHQQNNFSKDLDKTISVKDKKEKEKNVAPKKEKVKKWNKRVFMQHLQEQGGDAQLVHDYCDIRTKRRATFTATVAKTILREVNKADITLNEALQTCIERNWLGFKAEWYNNLNSESKGLKSSAKPLININR